MKKLYLFSALLFAFCTAASATCIKGEMSSTPPQNDCCPEVNDAISFDLTLFNDTCAVTYWIWNYGDGTMDTVPGSTLGVQHTYNISGIYCVTSTPYDTNYYQLNNGLSDCIEIYPAEGCPDCAQIDFSSNVHDCPMTATIFHGSVYNFQCEYDSITYLWDFGDPASGDSNYAFTENVQHIFSSNDNYYVTFTAKIYYGDSVCKVSKSQWHDPAPGSMVFIPRPKVTVSPNPAFSTRPVVFTYSGALVGSTVHIDFGDGTDENWNISTPISHYYPQLDTPMTYTIVINAIQNNECPISFIIKIVIHPPFELLPCKDCIGSFNPEPGKRYVLSAWVRENDAPPQKTAFTHPSIYIRFISSVSSPSNTPTMSAKGEIIDGWQRIEEEFIVPSDAVDMSINMVCASDSCLFDDIRVIPYDGVMKSFVYDPLTLRLVAELDERNYATLYEYDEEGKLARVKKETERGIMTIREHRNNTSKREE